MPSVEFYASAPSPDADFAAVQAGGVNAPSPSEHRWRLKADNGEIVASGEAHSSRADAKRAFMTVAQVIQRFNECTAYESQANKDGVDLTWRWKG